jgi:hypothetical protein
MLTDLQTRRVALARSLLLQAQALVNQPEPLCSFAILAAQDAVEMLLRLICDVHHADVKDKTAFLQYWDLISAKTGGKSPRHRGKMDRLNRARVAFKHHGVVPSRTECTEACRNAHEFMRDACHDLLGIDLEEMSLIDLIESERVRSHLREAQSAFAADDPKNCQEKCALAFAHLEHEYGCLTHEILGPFYGDSSMRRTGSLAARRDDATRYIHEDLDEIQRVLRRMEMGLDYGALRRFLWRGPFVQQVGYRRDPNPTFHLRWGRYSKATAADCRFSLSFVTDSALRVQRVVADLRALMDMDRPPEGSPSPS